MSREPIDTDYDPNYGDWDIGHAYAWRTWLRVRLPMVLIDLGVADKGDNCVQARAWHRWYEQDDQIMACYHCKLTKPNEALSGVVVDAE